MKYLLALDARRQKGKHNGNGNPGRIAAGSTGHVGRCALALANEAALAEGADPSKSLVSISEESTAAGPVWRISYGPRDYVGRRGGDLIVFVDDGSQTIQRILRGQ